MDWTPAFANKRNKAVLIILSFRSVTSFDTENTRKKQFCFFKKKGGGREVGKRGVGGKGWREIKIHTLKKLQRQRETA